MIGKPYGNFRAGRGIGHMVPICGETPQVDPKMETHKQKNQRYIDYCLECPLPSCVKSRCPNPYPPSTKKMMPVYRVDMKEMGRLLDEGLTVKEVAKALGVPRGCIQYRLDKEVRKT